VCKLLNEIGAAEFGDVRLIILSSSVCCFCLQQLLLLVQMLEVTVIIHITSLSTLWCSLVSVAFFHQSIVYVFLHPQLCMLQGMHTGRQTDRQIDCSA